MCLGASTYSYAQSAKDFYTINKEEIKISFTSQYRFSDLSDVKEKLENLKIRIVYTSLKFDEKGNLNQISAKIEYPDGTKASFVSSELEEKMGPGFRHKLAKS